MILELKNLSKSFGDFVVLDNLTWQVKKGSIMGLIGSNGAGKSTLLRCIAGVYECEGAIFIDGEPRRDDCEKLFFIPDDPFYFNRFSTFEMKGFYKSFYDNFDESLYQYLLGRFAFDDRKNINLLSKGLKRQSALILALSCRPELLLMDESFDGLDPRMRFVLKQELINLTSEAACSVIISSHNIRELEDISDHLALLENQEIFFSKSLEELNSSYHKLQLGYEELPSEEFFRNLGLLSYHINNKIVTCIYQGGAIEEQLLATKPLLVNPQPLSLEEIMVAEMEAQHA